jgi:hypothetical protein
MTRAQNSLGLDDAVRADGAAGQVPSRDPAAALRVINPTPEELAAHDAFMQVIRKASAGKAQ